MAVSRILAAKGDKVITARPTDTVFDVARKLAEHRIGAVVISSDTLEIEGIVSERDIVAALAKDGALALSRTAQTIMSRNIKTCKAGDSEADLMALMTQHRIRHLPVVSGKKLAGMVSIGDVVKNRIEAMEHESEQLRVYIASAG